MLFWLRHDSIIVLKTDYVPTTVSIDTVMFFLQNSTSICLSQTHINTSSFFKTSGWPMAHPWCPNPHIYMPLLVLIFFSI